MKGGVFVHMNGCQCHKGKVVYRGGLGRQGAANQLRNVQDNDNVRAGMHGHLQLDLCPKTLLNNCNSLSHGHS
eukprot:1161515-Pelagomonas_calceolata.AAC.18